MCSVQSRFFQLVKCVDKLHSLPVRVDLVSRSIHLYIVPGRHVRSKWSMLALPCGDVRAKQWQRSLHPQPVGLLHNAERDGDPPLRRGTVSDEQHVRQLRPGDFQFTGLCPFCAPSLLKCQ